MGVYYGGDAFLNYINKKFKLGVSKEKTPAKRLSTLRQEHTNFELYCYLPLIDDTKAEREALEAHVKMVLDRAFPELTQVGNDHFVFKATKETHKERVYFYIDYAMQTAIEYCNTYNIKHEEIVYPNYKKCGVRGKNKSSLL